MKYSIIKEKEGFSSQVRKYSEHKFKKDVLKELESIANSWSRNGGYIVKFNKAKCVLVVSESNDSATYIYQILEKY
jgi:ribosomal protein L14